jgi:hypothetical protein
MKEYLKGSQAIAGLQAAQKAQAFQDIYSSPSGTRNLNSRIIEEETIEAEIIKPNSINFNTIEKPKKKS